MRQLAQQACGWAVPYVDIDDYQRLVEIMDSAIHLSVNDMKSFLYAVVSNQHGEV
ncbi:MAG: hypothetical protein N3E45_17055 [Oscillatoriaceae bacterium SKW80]|nr:hypothetical protein [Oscillatoriaceae bacterium SKW80]HIK27968.1 hypothetical protein [Oscillatoriaceae cyanobacterium M7585_C2015_266]